MVCSINLPLSQVKVPVSPRHQRDACIRWAIKLGGFWEKKNVRNKWLPVFYIMHLQRLLPQGSGIVVTQFILAVLVVQLIKIPEVKFCVNIYMCCNELNGILMRTCINTSFIQCQLLAKVLCRTLPFAYGPCPLELQMWSQRGGNGED